MTTASAIEGWYKKNPEEGAWMIEYMIRKELGGYFPEDLNKQYFFGCLYSAFAKKQQKKMKVKELETKARKARGR